MLASTYRHRLGGVVGNVELLQGCVLASTRHHRVLQLRLRLSKLLIMALTPFFNALLHLLLRLFLLLLLKYFKNTIN